MKGRIYKESGFYILLAVVILRAADAGDAWEGIRALRSFALSTTVRISSVVQS